MKIAVLTPLFPPDIGEPAPYAKLLAEKLSSEHAVTVFCYGRLPEAAGPAKLVTTDKRLWLWLRVHLYLLKLLATQHRYDRFIVNNGPSTELPALFPVLFRKQATTLIISDPLAKAQATTGAYGKLHEFFQEKAWNVLDITNEPARIKPEQHPFKPFSPEVLTAHENWWHNHILTVTNHE